MTAVKMSVGVVIGRCRDETVRYGERGDGQKNPQEILGQHHGGMKGGEKLVYGVVPLVAPFIFAGHASLGTFQAAHPISGSPRRWNNYGIWSPLAPASSSAKMEPPFRFKVDFQTQALMVHIRRLNTGRHHSKRRAFRRSEVYMIKYETGLDWFDLTTIF